MARTFDEAGQADSARVLYEQFAATPSSSVWYDAAHLAHSYMRLAQLYEEQGEPERAAHYLQLFVDLLADADPEFQPRVEAARADLERLNTGDADLH
jgi:hypothetical protein